MINLQPLHLLALSRHQRPPRPVVRRAPMDAVPDMTGKTFLFICGLHRSGTSILHRMIRAHPATSGFEDTGVPEDEGQFLQSVLPVGEALGGPGRFAFHSSAHLTEADPLASVATADMLLREWAAYLDFDKTVLLEKSPPNIIRTRLLQALIPRSKFVFIVRHPIPVCLATEKWINRSRLNLMVHWCYAHKLMLDDISYINDKLFIRYEDFTVNPTGALQEIYNLLGIDSVPPIEDVVDHNPRYFRAWTDQWDKLARSATYLGLRTAGTVGRFAGVLEALGYRLSPPFVTEPQAGILDWRP